MRNFQKLSEKLQIFTEDKIMPQYTDKINSDNGNSNCSNCSNSNNNISSDVTVVKQLVIDRVIGNQGLKLKIPK